MKTRSPLSAGRRRLILFALACALASPDACALAQSRVSLSAPCAVVLDADRGKVIYSKSPSVTRPPASTVKVLTALVVLEHLSLNSWVRVSPRAARRERVNIASRAGEHFRARDLLRAMLVSSANDAATALAEAAAGSEAQFADLMTRKARALGARHSRFRNASGLPAKGQYSTATDMARIMNAARRSPLIVGILRLKNDVISSREGRGVALRNHNKMLWRTSGVVGKTGWTRRARHCYVAHVTSGGRNYVIAFLGSAKIWSDAGKLVALVRGGSDPPAKGSQASLIATNRRSLTTAQTVRLQRQLAGKGFSPGPVDGVFGLQTLSAVRQFQKSSGLGADGLVGPKTWRALEN